MTHTIHTSEPAQERVLELAQFIGSAQVLLFGAGLAESERVAELRRLFARHGHGDPFRGCPDCGEIPWCPQALAAAAAQVAAAPTVVFGRS